ncbi:hypothetical protein IAU60_000268 [Kwoniella sp. DSM 27419]
MPSVAPSTTQLPSTSLLAVLERAQKDDPLGGLVREALVLIETVLEGLGEDSVAMSFNGGKDCTVLLHLYAAALYIRHCKPRPAESIRPKADPSITIPHMPPRHQASGTTPNSASSGSTSTTAPESSSANGHDRPATPPPTTIAAATAGSSNGKSNATHHLADVAERPYPPIRAIYITAPNPFPELDNFVIDCTERYGMDLYRFGGGMKGALDEWLGCGGGKGVRGVLVGTRKGDPNDNVDVLAPTDPSWPQFLRIHPILHWTYADVWAFLRELDVPYCSLYDEGYTSLGSTTNTSPNPLLKNSSAASGWNPAYMLQDASQERAGRH